MLHLPGLYWTTLAFSPLQLPRYKQNVEESLPHGKESNQRANATRGVAPDQVDLSRAGSGRLMGSAANDHIAAAASSVNNMNTQKYTILSSK